MEPLSGSAVPALETSLRLEALETLAFQALYVGGRQLTSFRGRTLTAGVAQLDHIPLAPGETDIRVVYQRYGGPQEVLVTSVTSTAPPIATLRGQITDAVTGAPLGGATITVAPDGAEPIAITTASDGRYQTAIPSGAYAVTVRPSGFLPASGTDVAALGEIIETDHALLRWSTGTPSVTPTGSGGPLRSSPEGRFVASMQR